MLYHTVEVCTHDRADLWADTNPLVVLDKLKEFLGYAQKDGGVETLSVGTVEADTIDAALNRIRAEEYVSVVHCDGVTPEKN